jgi:molybdate transport repressor ModE-like protein
LKERYMLDARRLRVLHQVAASGSLSAAARALSFTPSAVSQQIATLEAEAGVALVERAGRGVRLTDAGRALVARSEVILRELQQAEADVRAVLDLQSGLIRVGAFPTAGTRLVPAAILRFTRRHPGVDVRLIESEPEQSLPQLRAGELDLALVFECDLVPLALDPAVGQETLFREPMYLALPNTQAPARPVVDLAALADISWIAASPGSAIHTVSPLHEKVAIRKAKGNPGRRVLAAWYPSSSRSALIESLIDDFRAVVAEADPPGRQRVHEGVAGRARTSP